MTLLEPLQPLPGPPGVVEDPDAELTLRGPVRAVLGGWGVQEVTNLVADQAQSVLLREIQRLRGKAKQEVLRADLGVRPRVSLVTKREIRRKLDARALDLLFAEPRSQKDSPELGAELFLVDRGSKLGMVVVPAEPTHRSSP